LELPTLVTGREAVRYYRILEYDFIDLVKNGGLQPRSQFGKPIEPPYRQEIKVILAESRGILRKISKMNIANRNTAEWLKSSDSKLVKHSKTYPPEEFEKLTARRSAIDVELAALDVNDRSWKYLHIPDDPSGKKELIMELLGYYYRPEEIESLGYSVKTTPDLSSAKKLDSKSAPEPQDFEPLTAVKSREYGLLKRRMERQGDVLRATVYATHFCIQQQPERVKRNQFFNELTTKFKILTTEDQQGIWLAMREVFPEYIHGAGRDRKPKQEVSEDDE
jgi:hypothetical protein